MSMRSKTLQTIIRAEADDFAAWVIFYGPPGGEVDDVR